MALAAGCGDDGVVVGDIPAEDATLTVVNDSSFFIDALFIAPAGEPFGSDELDGQGLFPGEEITLVGFPCDFYDLELVDEVGAVCTVLDVELCFEDEVFFIDDDFLLACDEGFFSAPANENQQLSSQLAATAALK